MFNKRDNEIRNDNFAKAFEEALFGEGYTARKYNTTGSSQQGMGQEAEGNNMDENDLHKLVQKLRPQPPADAGVQLLTIPRGKDEELRLRIKDYEGHPFISVEKWKANVHGDWWPQKGSVSIRVRELTEVAAALEEAARLLIQPVPDQA